EANPWTIMGSYNRINGTYGCENEHTLNKALKKDLAYDGLVVSDWGAMNERVDALKAGVELEMPGTQNGNDAKIAAAICSGQLDVAILDCAVERLLNAEVLSGVSVSDDEIRPEVWFGAEGVSTRFDWAADEARSGNGKVFVLQSDTQDPLSLAYQAMRLIRRGVTSVVVLDGQEARAYDLMLLAEETVELPAGQFPAWRVRIGLQSNPQVFTELWLGKETYGMPIRIRESLGDGSFRELVAERISVEAP
ncbi:MAG: DUF3108 domain-containing protein, partial [Syntrophobacteraceae bacterium]|nr:DUF3108 domain-containing protein [Syntrophobacteraceae bacterium]